MDEGRFLFTLDYEQFTEDWSQEILFIVKPVNKLTYCQIYANL